MKSLLSSLLLLSFGLTSCTPSKWQMQAPCPGSSNEELISALTALVAQEGMDILIVNAKLGILQSRGFNSGGIFSPGEDYFWNFSIRNDTIFAFAKTSGKSVKSKSDDFGTVTSKSSTKEKYYTNENASKGDGWFWNVYNGIVVLCEDQVILFLEK